MRLFENSSNLYKDEKSKRFIIFIIDITSANIEHILIIVFMRFYRK